jgi:hypothetical protein
MDATRAAERQILPLCGLAQKLIEACCTRQHIQSGQLTLHAGRGSSMTSKPVALLLADLGVAKTRSRPHVSNDNPFSEAGFKTLKCRPDFPERFGSIEDAREFCGDFFRWYNGAPPQRARAAHAERRASRPRGGATPGAVRDPRSGVCGAGAAFRRRPTLRGPAPEHGVDQPLGHAGAECGGGAVKSRSLCLIHVDRFRGSLT